METLQNMLDAFGELGDSLIAVIFLLVALLLGSLIVRASRRNGNSDSIHHPQTGRSRYHEKTATPRQTVDTVSQQVPPMPEHSPESDAVQAQSAAKPVSQPTEPVVKATAPVADDRDGAELEAQNTELSNPYPTDSVLRRHYETLHNSIPAPSKLEPVPVPVVSEIITPKASKPKGSSIIEMAINKDEQVTPAAVAVIQTMVSGTAKSCMPEDSVLKRHFMQRAQAEIAAEIGPKPSDSVLKRHFEVLFQQALEKRLKE